MKVKTIGIISKQSKTRCDVSAQLMALTQYVRLKSGFPDYGRISNPLMPISEALSRTGEERAVEACEALLAQNYQ